MAFIPLVEDYLYQQQGFSYGRIPAVMVHPSSILNALVVTLSSIGELNKKRKRK